MRKFKKYLLLLPVVAAVSCGYSVNYLVPGDRYTSANFQENYYRHWDKELKSAKLVETKDVTSTSITSFADLEKVDPNFSLPGAPSTDREYGKQYKMNSVDELFNYGYQSKLFDGQMVCGAQDGNEQFAYQKGRVQIDEKGFSARFSKESSALHYFAMQFKASTDNTVDCYPVGSTTLSKYGTTLEEHNLHDAKMKHSAVVELTITLYVKTNKGIVGHPYKSSIPFVDTNNDGHYYVFYAFDLQSENLSRLVGVSATYTTDDELIKWNKKDGRDIDITSSLLLYEMFFPYTSWN